jgi:lipopolysaccharide transport protein LptA
MKKMFLGVGVLGVLLGGRGPVLSAEVSTDLPKTVITSQSARVMGKGQSVEFTGKVTLTRGDDFLSADRLVTEDKNTWARAWGNVFFRRTSSEEGVLWEAWGDRAVYDTQTASGTLWGKNQPARARRTSALSGKVSGGTVNMLASQITLAQAHRSTATSELSTGILYGLGGVYIKSVETAPLDRVTELWSDRVHFDGPADRFRMEGAFVSWAAGAPAGDPPPGLDRPYARQIQGLDRRELRGTIIDMHPESRRLVVEKMVRADLVYESVTPGPVRGPREGGTTGVSTR